MANQVFAGFVYTGAGVVVVGATVDLLDRNTTTPVLATTTTNASGYWTISHATEGRFDVRITNGTSISFLKYDDQLQIEGLEVAVLRVRNPADTFDYDIVAAAITADRIANLPLLTGTATFAMIDHGIKGADISSVGAALTLVAGSDFADVTGTTTVTSISTRPAGSRFTFQFDGALILTHNATTLILQGAVNLTTAAGDVLTFISEGGGNWREESRRLAASGVTAMTRAGGNTTEATTTSTSAVDLLSVASLNIATNIPIIIFSPGRKTAGASTAAGTGLKVNATVTGEASITVTGMTRFSSSNQAESKAGIAFAPPRLTNYNEVGSIFGLSSGDSATSVAVGTAPSTTAAQPIETVTDIVMRGITTSLVTVGADELQVFTLTAAAA